MDVRLEIIEQEASPGTALVALSSQELNRLSGALRELVIDTRAGDFERLVGMTLDTLLDLNEKLVEAWMLIPEEHREP